MPATRAASTAAVQTFNTSVAGSDYAQRHSVISLKSPCYGASGPVSTSPYWRTGLGVGASLPSHTTGEVPRRQPILDQKHSFDGQTSVGAVLVPRMTTGGLESDRAATGLDKYIGGVCMRATDRSLITLTNTAATCGSFSSPSVSLQPADLRAKAAQMRAALAFDVRKLSDGDAHAYAAFRTTAEAFRIWHRGALEAKQESNNFRAAVARWLQAVVDIARH